MKNLIIFKKSNFFAIVAFSFLLFSTNAFASFPVKKDKATEITVENQTTTNSIFDENESESGSSSAIAVGGYDKWVAAALWFVLGWPFAAHRWYAGKPAGWNILFILTFAGLGVWAIVDIVNILTDNFQN